jgi:hypothetical protein
MKPLEIIDEIDKVLVEGGEDAKCLWDILTALRGPDADPDRWNEPLKKKYTAPLRGVVFPKTLERARGGLTEVERQLPTFAKDLGFQVDGGSVGQPTPEETFLNTSHWSSHHRLACKAWERLHRD